MHHNMSPLGGGGGGRVGGIKNLNIMDIIKYCVDSGSIPSQNKCSKPWIDILRLCL